MSEREDMTSKAPLRKKKKRRSKSSQRKRLSERTEGQESSPKNLSESERRELIRRKKKKKKKKKKKLLLEGGNSDLATSSKKPAPPEEEPALLGEEDLVGAPKKKKKKRLEDSIPEKKSSDDGSSRENKRLASKSTKVKDKKGSSRPSSRAGKSEEGDGSGSSRSKRFTPQQKKVDPKMVLFMYGTPGILIILILAGIFIKNKQASAPTKVVDEKKELKEARKLEEEGNKLKGKFASSRNKKDAQGAIKKYKGAFAIMNNMMDRRIKEPKKWPPLDINDDMTELQRKMHDLQKMIGW